MASRASSRADMDGIDNRMSDYEGKEDSSIAGRLDDLGRERAGAAHGVRE
jgi:hypothetical protein